MADSTQQHTAAASAGTFAIIAVSALAGMLIHWNVSGPERYTRDWLMRARGPLPVPDDIAVVAIDEPSIARLGRFPWPRSVMARLVDAVAQSGPKAIALDVLYTDPASPDEDAQLARSVAAAGNVVVAAQLVEPAAYGLNASWLMPLEAIRSAAAGVGHVNVLAESEGVARELLVRMIDNSGISLPALPLEAVRTGERIPVQRVIDTGDAIQLGSRRIPVEVPAASVVLGEGANTRVFRPARMTIDYIGPTGAFAPNTISASDVLEGKAGTLLRGRYVLIGATAAGLGERFPTPFVHGDGAFGQHGTLMPGVEVLANAINTILRSRFYSTAPDWASVLWVAAIAAVTLFALSAAQGRFELGKQVLSTLGIAVGILAIAFLFYSRFLLILPVTAAFVSFISAGLLGLMRRSLVTSARLDQNIADLMRAGNLLVAEMEAEPAASAIARLTAATGVSIYAARGKSFQRVAHHGLAIPYPAGDLASSIPERSTVEKVDLPGGVLLIAHEITTAIPAETLRLCSEIAASCISLHGSAGPRPGGRWPRALETKARALGWLNARLIERTGFVDQALRSAEDGLLITGPDGTIRFANRGAANILLSTEGGLIGRNFFDRLAECDGASVRVQETLSRLLLERTVVEREVVVRGARLKYYALRLAPVASAAGPVSGIVASLSDITRQKELQQTKNDVIALVSHEMRTPLSAIQGMSEILANYQVDPQRSREMNTAINEEVKRLTRMITEYLDITRLESGAAVLRKAPIRMEQLLDRAILVLQPLASERGIRLEADYEFATPPVVADADLLSRAISNLISNAIKYSPANTRVRVTARGSGNHLAIQVEDQGYGISEADQARIFDKFYRVPRAQDADVPGTGLGLALVREVAELHGGSVTVQSELNAGSTFTLSIPLQEVTS